MKVLKTFEDFSIGNTSESNDNYPAGAANDPNAPWNKEDYDTDRNSTLKQSDLKFDLVASDFSEYAILKEKSTGKMFAVAFEPDELEDYVEYEKIPVGRECGWSQSHKSRPSRGLFHGPIHCARHFRCAR